MERSRFSSLIRRCIDKKYQLKHDVAKSRENWTNVSPIVRDIYCSKYLNKHGKIFLQNSPGSTLNESASLFVPRL